MNIKKISFQQVKQDEAATRTRDSVRKESEDQHIKRKERYKAKKQTLVRPLNRGDSNLEQIASELLDCTDQQELLIKCPVPQQAALNINGDRQLLMFQGSAELNLHGTVHLREDTAEEIHSPATVHTAIQFFQAHDLSQASQKGQRNELNTTSILSMDEPDEERRTPSKLNTGHDAMRALQTKQHSLTYSPRSPRSPRRQLSLHNQELGDVGRQFSNVQNKGSSNRYNKQSKTSTSYSPAQATQQNQMVQRVPNLDIIEDVSRASQALAHELLHSKNLPVDQAVQLIAIVDPYTTLEASAQNLPQPSNSNGEIIQHTIIPSAKFAENFMSQIDEATPNPTETNQSSESVSPPPGRTLMTPKKSRSKKSPVTIKAANAFNPVSVMVRQISDEDRFKNVRTGIQKNSFERASKSYFLHQQKMLRKEQLLKRQREKEALEQARIHSRSKEELLKSSTIHSTSTSNNNINNNQENEILFDSPKRQQGMIGVVVRRSNRGDPLPSMQDQYPGQNQNIEFTPISVQDQKVQKKKKPRNQSPKLQTSGFANFVSDLGIQNQFTANVFGGSITKRSSPRILEPNEQQASKRHFLLDNKDLPKSSLFVGEQTQSKFYNTTNCFGNTQNAMIIGRQVVPVVSKMRQVNLLNTKAMYTPNMKFATQNNFHTASQGSYGGSYPPATTQEHDHDVISAKTIFDTAGPLRLDPRPINFIQQIQNDRELKQLKTADGTYTNDSRPVQHPSILREDQASNLQIQEKEFSEPFEHLQQTLKAKDEIQASAPVSNFDEEAKKKSQLSVRKDEGQIEKQPSNIARQNQISDMSVEVPHRQQQNQISDMSPQGGPRQQSETRELSNLGAKAYENDRDQRISEIPDRNNSRFSNTVTLKPPSPCTPHTPPPSKLDEKAALDMIESGEKLIVNSQSLYRSHNSRQHVVSVVSKQRSPNKTLVSSSESLGGKQVPLEDYDSFGPSFMNVLEEDTDGSESKDDSRCHDSEKYLYSTLLKMIQPNSSANVIKDLQKIVLSDNPDDYGQVKPLLYRKWNRQDQASKYFKKEGVIDMESFQFDELKRKRTEFMNYCLTKINYAIKDQPMPEKEQKKSPLNIQTKNSKNRRNQRYMLSEMLETQYGLTFADNPTATQRMLNGQPSAENEKSKQGIFGLQTIKDIRKFEALNGIKILPEQVQTVTPPIDRLNEQSQFESSLLGQLPRLSQISCTATPIPQEKSAALKLALTTSANFELQPNQPRKSGNQASKQQQFLNQPLNAVSGDLKQEDKSPSKSQMIIPCAMSPPEQSKKEKSVKKTSVFKNRLKSLEPNTSSQYANLEQDSRTMLNFGGRRNSQLSTISRRGFGVKGYFSGHQRLENLFDFENSNFSRDQLNKNTDPKLIEIINKMRDPSLTADYYVKTGIRPHVVEKTKAHKLNQKVVDQHIQKHSLDNLGCPLLPIHKMDTIYNQQMLTNIHTPAQRPKEKSWQQLNVMLPILRQNCSTNIRRNDKMLQLDSQQERECQMRLAKNTIHSPADLTVPSITQQNKKHTSAGSQQFEHRIEINDIIQVKKNNNRELFVKKIQMERAEAEKLRRQADVASLAMAAEIEKVAEQMSLPD